MKLELRGITKRFGSLVANDHIDLTVAPGEVHCLLGENGAGKSTLMNVLYGLYRADEGSILLDDVEQHFEGPGDAMAAGIGMVHQHFMLIPVFTVAENVMLGHEDTKRGGRLDLEKARATVREISARFGFHIDPDALVEDLPVGVQQRVEIIKALSRDANVLVFDEPTAVLTPQETDELMAIMRQLREAGTVSGYPTVPWEPILRGQIEEADDDTISNIVAALYDNDSVVQLQAAIALYWLAPSAKSAIPHLAKATMSKNWRLRSAAYRALAAIGRTDLSTFPYLVEAWPQDEVVRDELPQWIREYDEGIHAELEKLYSTGSTEFRRALIEGVLGRAKSAEKLIILGLNDDDERIRVHSLRMVRQLDATDGVVAALRPLLKCDDANQRLNAAAMLIAFETESESALEALSKLIADGGQPMRTFSLNVFVGLPGRTNNTWEQGGKTIDRLTRREKTGVPESLALRTIQQLNSVLGSDRNQIRPAAMMALASLQSSKAAKELDLNWGPSRAGLRSCLSVVTLLSSSDEPLTFRLEVRKSNNEPLRIDELFEFIQGSLRVLGPDSKEVHEMDFRFSEKPLQKDRGADAVLAFEAKLDVKKYLSDVSGTILFQFHSERLFASNVLSVKVPSIIP